MVQDSVWDSEFNMKYLKKTERNWLKHCAYHSKDEVNSLNFLSNNNYQASSKKFRQIILIFT